jgi:acyl-CoA synthetase (AMP-forming)/AMP-acid ligase II
MSGFPQDKYWLAGGIGGELRTERHFDGRVMRCYGERPGNVDAMFRAVLARHGAREALVGDDQRITYTELGRLVDNAAGNLAACGIGAGDRVALLLGNCPEFLVLVLACARLGAIAVPIGTRQPAPEIEYVLNDCGAVVLVLENEFAANLPDRAAVPSVRRCFMLGDPVGGGEHGAEPAASLFAPAVAPATPAIAEDGTAVILYTSGTTGRPKGAMLTHLGMVHAAISFGRCLGLSEQDRTMLAVPASHVTGLIAIHLATLNVGGCVLLLRNFKARAFLELAARERMTYTLVVPAIYMLCLLDPEFERFDLSAWRVGGFGGAPMPEATIETLARKLPGLNLVNAYGATETTSPTTIMPFGLALDYRDTVGQVVPCGEVIVVDEAGRPVPPGVAGEIWIRGPMVVPGYWNRPEATAAGFTDGFWHSGDIGSLDAEGFVRVFDRLKDMLNRGGFKVYSAEVENVLALHPAVVESAVVGRPDPVLGERVVAFILSRDPSLAAEEIQRFCRARLADYKVPEIVVFVSEPLPRNANGKVRKVVLRERAAGVSQG